jgi:HrpA-like RNA helicase
MSENSKRIREEVRNKMEDLVELQHRPMELSQSIDAVKHLGIYIASMPTGAGKTHNATEANALLEDILKDEGKRYNTAITMPTRANVKNAHSDALRRGLNYGYSIGGESEQSREDIGSFYTYGKLMNEAKKDPLLRKVDNLILDEADLLKSGEEKWIPYLIFLTRARPELNILLMSATLDVKQFKDIFHVPEENLVEVKEGQRARPIDYSYYEGETDKYNRKIVKFEFKFDEYIPNIYKKTDSWLLEMENDEAMIVFMPTYRGVNYIANKFSNRNNLEVRTLTARMKASEIEDIITRVPEPGKKLLIVSTDVVARGINFGPEIKLNRAIDSGLRNTLQYNPLTGRNTLRITKATNKQLKQSLGRAGRLPDDTRTVKGYVAQQPEALESIKEENFQTDPTQMILESAEMINRINDTKVITPNELPIEFRPKDLVEYITPAIGNKDLTKATVDRLVGMNAIDTANNITEFGQFLLKMNLPIDFGIIIFESLNSENSHFTEYIVKILNIISNSTYLINNEVKFKELVRLQNFKNDFEFYIYLIKNFRNSEDTQNIGVDFSVLEDAFEDSKLTLDTIKNLGFSIQSKPFKLDELNSFLSKVSINGLSHTLCKKQNDGSYMHLATGTIVQVSKKSIMNNNPEYILAGEFGTYSTGHPVISSAIETNLEEIKKATTYTSWLISEDTQVADYDVKSGVGRLRTDTLFKDFVLSNDGKDRIIDQQYENFSGGEKAIFAMASHVYQKNFYSNIKLRLEKYQEITNKINPPISKMMIDVMVNKFREKSIYIESEFENSGIELLASDFTDTYNDFETICPDNFEGYPIKYVNKEAFLDASLKEISEIQELGLLEDLSKLPVKLKMNFDGYTRDIDDKNIEEVVNSFISKSTDSVLNNIFVKHELNPSNLLEFFPSIEKLNEYKDGIIVCKHPITDEDVKKYIYISGPSSWGRYTIYLKDEYSDNSNLQDMIKTIEREKALDKEVLDELEKFKPNIDKIQDIDKEWYEIFMKDYQSILNYPSDSNLQRLKERVNKELNINYRGQEAIDKIKSETDKFTKSFKGLMYSAIDFEKDLVNDTNYLDIASLIVDGETIVKARVTFDPYWYDQPDKNVEGYKLEEDEDGNRLYPVRIINVESGPSKFNSINVEYSDKLLDEESKNQLVIEQQFANSQQAENYAKEKVKQNLWLNQKISITPVQKKQFVQDLTREIKNKVSTYTNQDIDNILKAIKLNDDYGFALKSFKNGDIEIYQISLNPNTNRADKAKHYFSNGDETDDIGIEGKKGVNIILCLNCEVKPPFNDQTQIIEPQKPQ